MTVPVMMRMPGMPVSLMSRLPQAIEPLAVVDHLELERGVANAERFELGEHRAERSGVLLELGNDRVAAHRDDPAGDGPDVQVVDVVDTGDGEQSAADLVQRDVRRRILEEHVGALTEELPRSAEDEQGQRDRNDRVGEGPSG